MSRWGFITLADGSTVEAQRGLPRGLAPAVDAGEVVKRSWWDTPHVKLGAMTPSEWDRWVQANRGGSFRLHKVVGDLWRSEGEPK